MSARKPDSRPIVAMIAFLVIAMCVYFVILGRMAVNLIGEGTAVSIGLGVGVFILPLLGVWMIVATLKSGIEHQRMAAAVAADR